MMLQELTSFISSTTPVFLLKGYAGTGKTTLLKTFLAHLNAERKPFTVMAPTGRAAKVIRQKTSHPAVTIHKAIYQFDDLQDIPEGEDDDSTFKYHFALRNNGDTAHVYIVDEASMVSNEFSEGPFFRFGSGHLLADLISYTRVTDATSRNKLLFVGDPGQLLPVNDAHSRALDEPFLHEAFGLKTESITLTHVHRQKEGSGILEASKRIRQSLTSGFFNDFDLSANGADLLHVSAEDFLDTYFRTAGRKCIVGYKNKTCAEINERVREAKHGRAGLPPQPGDVVIIGGNNYPLGIMNGEFAVVVDAAPNPERRTREIYNGETKRKESVTLTWRQVTLQFPDEETEGKTVSGMLLENYLYGGNVLSVMESKALYMDFILRHPKLKKKTPEFKEAITADRYFNAILLKYGYAVTCHKAQGGEWDTVFTIWDNSKAANFDFMRDAQEKRGLTNESFYRWAYTAITRASKVLYCLNPPRFNSYATLNILPASVTDALAEIIGVPVKVEELMLDEELSSFLRQHGLNDAPLPVQDWAIRVWHTVRKHYIDIQGVVWRPYLMKLTLEREGVVTILDTSYDKHFRFGEPRLSGKGDAQFGAEVTRLVSRPLPIAVQRNTAETILSVVDFELATEEQKPFLRRLYDDVGCRLDEEGIRIDGVAHGSYDEMYTFSRGAERAILRLSYNGDGFFTTAMFQENRCNSNALVADIARVFQSLKTPAPCLQAK